MPRPPLPIGTWGVISTWAVKHNDKGQAVKHKSQARFRDHDGRVRPVSAFGKTKTAAERALLGKLQDRAKTNQSGELTALHKIKHLIDLYEKKFTDWVADGKRSPTSLDNYQGAIKNHIRPALGELRIGEATTQRIDTVIAQIKHRAGAPRAKTCRAVLSGMMKLAVRYGAISVNPVREIETIETQPKDPPRALTSEEVTLLRQSLAADERAPQADLPDLVAFMLGTGVRIGEALAVLWSQVDLEAGTVEITSTIVRVKGEGLIRKRTKSKAGRRLLHLPTWAIAALRSRHATGIRLDDPIFADTLGGFRDPSNVRRSLRTALSPVGSTSRRDLGLTLRALRRDAGLTRKQVADTLNWTQARIELIETGWECRCRSFGFRPHPGWPRASALIYVCSAGQSEVMIHAEEERAISEVVERLTKRFPQLPEDQVAAIVEQSRPEFDAAPIRDFVPLFVERSAKNRLRRQQRELVDA